MNEKFEKYLKYRKIFEYKNIWLGSWPPPTPKFPKANLCIGNIQVSGTTNDI